MAQTPGEIHVTRFSDSSAFEMMRPYWNALLETSSINDPFLTWEWQSTWWEIYGSQNSLWLLVAWENEKPIGIFPLMQTGLEKLGVKGRSLCMIGKWDIDHCGIITSAKRPEILQAFASYLHQVRRQWDMLCLNNCLDCGQDLHNFLEALEPRYHTVKQVEVKPHLIIPLGREWESCRQNLPGKLRRKVRSKFTNLTSEHRVEFFHLRGDEVTPDRLNDFFEIGLAGRFPHLYQTDEDRRFHRLTVENMRENNWVSLNMLYIDGIPAAYHYGYIYSNKYYAWRTAYKPDFEQYAPGHIILNETLKYFSGIGLTEFDFLRGDARYKREWTNTIRNYCDWQVVRRWTICSLVFVRLPDLRAALINLFIEKKKARTTS